MTVDPQVIAALSAALLDSVPGDGTPSPLSAAGTGAREIKRLSWTSSQADSWSSGRVAQGFLLWNDGLSDANIGFNSSDVKSEGEPLLVIKAGAWIALPVITSTLFAGGNNDDGTLLLLAFDYAPTPAAGNIDPDGGAPDATVSTFDVEEGVALPRNAARREAIIFNNTGDTVYVLYGQGASSSNFTFLLPDKATLIIDSYTGDISLFLNAIEADGVQVTEIT